MKNYILVTGCAGFIGTNFVYFYLNKYPDKNIIGLDLLTYCGNLENLSKLKPDQKNRFTFIKGDINNYKLLNNIFSNYSINKIIHFAAESHVDRSIHNPKKFVKTNVLGTHNLLMVAKDHWLTNNKWLENAKFIQISTDEVYGTLGETGDFNENSPINPHNPYSSSKASADLVVKSYFDTYKMPINIVRGSNCYGSYQFPEKLIPLIINNALSLKPLPIYGDGKQIRDWLYSEDYCKAVDIVSEIGAIGDIYNVGSNNEIENIELVKLIISILREITNRKDINESLINHVPDRLGHDRRYAINSSKIQKDLGWKSDTSFKNGLKKTINWYLDNQVWLENVINRNYLNFYKLNYKF